MLNALIWDLETIPNFELIAETQKISIAKARAAAKQEFPRIPFHTIVCIGAVLCTRTASNWKIESIGAPSIADRTEAELVQSFVAKIEELKPTLITFNGSSFDFPVLRYRAMSHKLGSKVFQTKNYFNRYSDDSIDLCDVLASFDGRSKASLDTTCRVMGLAGKGTGINGADVEAYVATGRIREVADYCERDTVNTFRLWLRYELFRGTLTRVDFENTETGLREFVRGRASGKSHLNDLI